jgi:hypothetical protein
LSVGWWTTSGMIFWLYSSRFGLIDVISIQ